MFLSKITLCLKLSVLLQTKLVAVKQGAAVLAVAHCRAGILSVSN